LIHRYVAIFNKANRPRTDFCACRRDPMPVPAITSSQAHRLADRHATQRDEERAIGFVGYITRQNRFVTNQDRGAEAALPGALPFTRGGTPLCSSFRGVPAAPAKVSAFGVPASVPGSSKPCFPDPAPSLAGSERRNEAPRRLMSHRVRTAGAQADIESAISPQVEIDAVAPTVAGDRLPAARQIDHLGAVVNLKRPSDCVALPGQPGRIVLLVNEKAAL